VKTLTGHSGPVTGAAFTAGGAKLVTGSHDKTFRVGALATVSQLPRSKRQLRSMQLPWSPKGNWFATGGATM